MKKKLICLMTALLCLSSCSNQAENTASTGEISNKIYDEFIEEWKAQGGQEVLDEVNRLKK